MEEKPLSAKKRKEAQREENFFKNHLFANHFVPLLLHLFMPEKE